MAKEITITLPGGVKLVMVRIPAGTFTMGSPESERGSDSRERPQHQVTLSTFYLGKTEVTQAQWQAVTGTPMPTSCGSYGTGSDYPVYCLTWDDVTGPGGFIEKLDQQQGTMSFRLPTEAEWEYAARAGTTTRFSHGDVLDCGDSCESCATHAQYMWWCGNAGSTSHPVAQKLPNGFGLYDMHGSVWEWVGDWYGSYGSGAQTDPTGPTTGSYRVARGANWNDDAVSCRSATRAYYPPDTRDYTFSFRLASSVLVSCAYSLEPSSRTHTAAAETGELTVGTAAGCPWWAASGADWISITAGASGSGPGTVTYAVEANPTTADRAGTITVQGQTFTVTQAAAPGEITITLPGNVSLVLLRIPAGTFTMGAPTTERGYYGYEGPPHQVTITQDYYLGKTEVTQAQWQAVMGGSNPAHDHGVGPDYPVYNVSWNDICGGTTGSGCLASSFIGSLNQQQGVTKFRLPSEAEWEYAARAGTAGPFSFDTSGNPSWDTSCGSFPEALTYMWWCGNNTPSGSKQVGQKSANAFGLHDMHGNVWEWVQDWWHDSYTGAPTDGSAWESPAGSYRVARGGSFSYYSRYCRSAARDYSSPDYRSYSTGFRLARSQ